MTVDPRASRDGVIAALIAYVMWGFLPVYFLVTTMVAPGEMLAHRILWSVPTGALIIGARSQWPEVKRALTTSATLKWLIVSAAFISINWLIYIHAVQIQQIFQASLGYYINPLIYVVVGVVFFGERLSAWQGLAVALATAGVLVLTISGGEFPWIALTLAFSFTVYGVVRKQVVVGGMPGLFIETLVLFPIALGWLVWLGTEGTASYLDADLTLGVLLLLAGPLTVIPLLCFALAARRLRLSTIGFLQFIGPTLQFGVGVASGETLSSARLICFALIWTAVGVFCWDGLRQRRQRRAAAASASPSD